MRLKTVPGVIDVTGFGGTVKQYQILLDNQLMRRYDVTLQMVTDAISQSNANVGGDLLPLGPQSHNVRALGYLGEGIDSLDPAVADHAYALEIEKLEDIDDVVVTTYHDMPVYIRQIAKVVVGYQPRLGLVGRNGENDVVEGIVLMRKYEKSLPTSEAVQKKIDSINESNLLPKGMRIEYFNRRTDLVHVTKYNVIHNLVVGMILVIGILFIFLGDISSAGIVALMIPLALLFSVSVLFLQGKSANLLSIGAVDFGIIVDSSVIIVENIYRHITARNADRSRPLIDRICEASHEIERALFFSTLIIVCAFIPLFSMTGPEGALFGPMANTYAFAICGALLLAVTLTPVLCSYLFHEQEGGEGDVHRPHHEAAVPDDARPGVAAPIPGADGDGRPAGLHDRALTDAGRRIHAPARRRQSLDSRVASADGDAGGGGPDGPSASPGDRLDSRDQGCDVARRPARRRNRRHELLQPGIQRALDPDGASGVTKSDQDPREGRSGPGRSPARRSRMS